MNVLFAVFLYFSSHVYTASKGIHSTFPHVKNLLGLGRTHRRSSVCMVEKAVRHDSGASLIFAPMPCVCVHTHDQVQAADPILEPPTEEEVGEGRSIGEWPESPASLP